EPRIVRWLKAGYQAALRLLLGHPWWIIGAVTVLCLVTLALSRGFGGEFLPEFREGHYVVQINGAPGASLAEMQRVGETFAAELGVGVFGDDLDVLDAKAEEVKRIVEGVRGAADVKITSPPGLPEVVVHLRPERLRRFDFQPVEVLEAMQTAYQGAAVAQTY